MKTITVDIPAVTIGKIDMLMEMGYLKSRSEHVRIAVRDFIINYLDSSKNEPLQDLKSTIYMMQEETCK